MLLLPLKVAFLTFQPEKIALKDAKTMPFIYDNAYLCSGKRHLS